MCNTVLSDSEIFNFKEWNKAKNYEMYEFLGFMVYNIQYV